MIESKIEFNKRTDCHILTNIAVCFLYNEGKYKYRRKENYFVTFTVIVDSELPLLFVKTTLNL